MSQVITRPGTALETIERCQVKVYQWSSKKINDYLDKRSFEEFQRESNMREMNIKKNKKEETKAKIRDRVLSLPRAERLVIYLLFWEEASQIEVAKQLGITKVMVEKLASMAIEKLKIDLTSLEQAA